MALIDKEKLFVPLSAIVSNLRTYTAPEVLAADKADIPEEAYTDTEGDAETRGSEFFERAIPLLETFMGIIAAQEPVDPIHHAGGCYCRECKSCLFGRCLKKNFRDVSPGGFCDEGRRREEDANGRVE